MKIKSESVIRIAALTCLLLGALLLILSKIFTDTDNVRFTRTFPVEYAENWEMKLPGQDFQPAKVPQRPDIQPGETIILRNHLPMDLKDNSEFFFRAAHKRVKVTIDGELVTTFGINSKTLFSDTPGSAWLIIPVDSSMSGAEIIIELDTIKTTFSSKVHTFYIAPSNTASIYIVLRRLPNLLLCLVSVFFGILLIVAGLILHKLEFSKSLLRLGLLSLYMGMWESFGTKALQFASGDMIHVHVSEFYFFTMISPLFLWFFLSLNYYKNNRIVKAMFWFSIVIYVFIQVFAVTGLFSYQNTMTISHAYIFVFAIYIFIDSIGGAIREKKEKGHMMHLVSISAVLLFVFIDLVMFYVKSTIGDESFFTKIGMIIFISLWTISILSDASRVYKEAAQAELLKKLAYEDFMTKLKNRTAFEKALDYINTKQQETTVVLFDLNNMKEINDKHGHSKGDQILINMAAILKDTFEPEADCFRIGGDELCVLTKELPGESLQSKIQQVHNAIDKTVEETGIVFSAAVGLSRTNYWEDIGVSMAFNEADHSMYQCKRRMKLG